MIKDSEGHIVVVSSTNRPKGALNESNITREDFEDAREDYKEMKQSNVTNKIFEVTSTLRDYKWILQYSPDPYKEASPSIETTTSEVKPVGRLPSIEDFLKAYFEKEDGNSKAMRAIITAYALSKRS